MRLYLNDAGRIPRVTPEEAIALAARIAAGDVDAERRLVEANLRLVVAIARRFLGRGFPLPDLIQEGNLGLMKAVPRWRPALGGAFATYAAHWIRQGILRALQNTSSTIRLPVHFQAQRTRAGRARRRLEHRLGRAVTEAEVQAEFLAAGEGRLPRRAPTVVVSLDAPLRGHDDGGDDLTLGALIVDETTASPEDLSVARETTRIRAAMARLTPQQARVIDLRYGLSTGDDPLTLEAVGARLGLTRERIRQIEAKSLGRLRKQLTRTVYPARTATTRMASVGSNGHRPAQPDAPAHEVVRLRTRRGSVVRRFGVVVS